MFSGDELEVERLYLGYLSIYLEFLINVYWSQNATSLQVLEHSSLGRAMVREGGEEFGEEIKEDEDAG